MVNDESRREMSVDFECGQWVHIPCHIDHQFAGYDGKILLICEDTVSVEIHDLSPGEQPLDLALVPYVCLFGVHEIQPIPFEERTTFDVLKETVGKWNKWLNED